MGRRKNNPELVEYLKAFGATMDTKEFTELYNSLSSSDMDRLDKEVREEFESDDWDFDDEDDEDDE